MCTAKFYSRRFLYFLVPGIIERIQRKQQTCSVPISGHRFLLCYDNCQYFLHRKELTLKLCSFSFILLGDEWALVDQLKGQDPAAGTAAESTYCSSLYKHCETVRRAIHIVNLDPAAENFDYPVAMDVRELISLDDVMEELGLGPNGGLVYCMEHLEDNLNDWLDEELDNYLDDEYLVFDCPGQIELYSHVPVFRNFVEHLKRRNFNVCVVYLLDSQFMVDVTKFISGCMASLSAMVQLELPHVNILSKMDLVTNKKDLEEFLDPEPTFLLSELNKRMAPQYAKLNKALIELVGNL
ncbi:GPN-loop GTPase [Trifolium pratense]|uniref:GPN-loop GTPase 3 n=2 Tax=Trifolium TaxID=3898 RepID=A0A2K3NDA3_TRIPR|nr:GPN-loop GTPase [Trifolium pratense]